MRGSSLRLISFIFFFQAEDGIRDLTVTGVQTCALPILNDAAGHAVGDRALRDTAALLRHTFRDSDLVARIGGGEYARLVRPAGPQSARGLAQRVKRQPRDLNRRAGPPHQPSVSLPLSPHKNE